MIAKSVLEFETVACDLCHSTDFRKMLDGVDWEFGREEQFTIAQCTDCGLVQLNPRPTAASIPQIYPAVYGFYEKPSQPSQISWLRRMRSLPRAWASRGKKRLRNLIRPSGEEPWPPPRMFPYFDFFPRGGRVFDVGCATGSSCYPYGESGSLLDLKRKGWDVSGCEIDEEAARIANDFGLNISVGKVTDVALRDGHYDVVRFNHVLEHSVSPLQDLKTAVRIMRRGGNLLISGPNIESACFYLFQRCWSGLDVPRHFYQFTPASLRKYCEAVGLSVSAEFFDSIPDDFMHSVRHVLHSEKISGAPKACSREDALEEVFQAGSLRNITLSLIPLVNFFNKRGLGDNYTLVARKK